MGKLKLLGVGLGAIAVFSAGVSVEHWRLSSRYQKAEIARERATREALEANARHVASVNAETAEREAALLDEMDRDQAFIRELQAEIRDRPFIREEIRVPVEVDGVLECPPVAVVDWGLFQHDYNRAASGPGATDAPSDRDAPVPGGPADDRA